MRIGGARRWPPLVVAIVLLGIAIRLLAAPQQSATALPASTQIVLLGTGTPAADPDRFGPATAIIVNETAYLVDAGAGIVRRAAAAARDRSLKSLQAANLRIVFLTHLHSDHTVGLPDLILSPWTLGRRVALEAYGPPGTVAMAQHLLEAYRSDIETRTNPDGNQRDYPEGHDVNAHEVRAGVVYKDANVTVTAFATSDETDVVPGECSPLDYVDWTEGWKAGRIGLRPLVNIVRANSRTPVISHGVGQRVVGTMRDRFYKTTRVEGADACVSGEGRRRSNRGVPPGPLLRQRRHPNIAAGVDIVEEDAVARD